MGGHGLGDGEAWAGGGGSGQWIGPYRVVALLGEGGMGAVYLGRDVRGRVAAVKVLRVELAADEGMVRRFRREADAAAAVRGRGVARVLGYDLDGPVPWIAAAYLAGPTLHQAVAACGVLDGNGTRALGAELARTVAEIHAAGLVHRDLKPSNIVLTRAGPCVIDFGIARPEYGLTLTEPGLVPATPGYAPPEQVTGRRAGPPADVFALGAVLAFACTGRGPFGSGHPAAVSFRVVHEEPSLDGVPETLVPVVRACLEKDPARRPTPGELARALVGEGAARTAARPPRAGRRLTGSSSASAPPWRHGPLADEIARRTDEAAALLKAEGGLSRRAVFAAGAGAVVAGGGGATGWWLSRDRDPGGGAAPVTADGVPVAEPLARPTAGTVPQPFWTAGQLSESGPGPVTADRVVVVGTGDGLAAFAQHTGARAWTWAGGAAPDRAGPLLVAGRTVLVVTADGRLTALDARRGARLWSVRADAEQALALDAAHVYVLDGDRRVKALARADGAERWTARRALGSTGAVSGAAAGDRLMAVARDGGTLVLDTESGAVRWERDIGRPRHVLPSAGLTPAPVRDGFCVGGDTLALLDARGGGERWSVPAEDSFWGAPTVADGRVYAARLYTVRKDELTCRDAGNGDPRWSVPFDFGAEPVRPGVVLGNALYGALGRRTGPAHERLQDLGVYTADIRTGRLLWTFNDDVDQAGWRLAGAAGRVFVARRTTLRALPVF
ncbi:serine/threonine-protein kinase [Streptomyces sp. NPDC050704]|uniref:serine/threonine-protein kinase n=1 Tax=Streptomyces sp. NPDC050704 TaxID=3157219 RepID=UPI00344458F7